MEEWIVFAKDTQHDDSHRPDVDRRRLILNPQQDLRRPKPPRSRPRGRRQLGPVPGLPLSSGRAPHQNRDCRSGGSPGFGVGVLLSSSLPRWRFAFCRDSAHIRCSRSSRRNCSVSHGFLFGSRCLRLCAADFLEIAIALTLRGRLRFSGRSLFRLRGRSSSDGDRGDVFGVSRGPFGDGEAAEERVLGNERPLLEGIDTSVAVVCESRYCR
mmetsp:Transcript_13701/g.24748  ORF Transcript_13701/g.24748 Transcript_13701/m.24748 type:complete len:212 (+) Transcript_13701:369-1004(+)